jgi:hypothetical protein
MPSKLGATLGDAGWREWENVMRGVGSKLGGGLELPGVECGDKSKQVTVLLELDSSVGLYASEGKAAMLGDFFARKYHGSFIVSLRPESSTLGTKDRQAAEDAILAELALWDVIPDAVLRGDIPAEQLATMKVTHVLRMTETWWAEPGDREHCDVARDDRKLPAMLGPDPPTVLDIAPLRAPLLEGDECGGEGAPHDAPRGGPEPQRGARLADLRLSGIAARSLRALVLIAGRIGGAEALTPSRMWALNARVLERCAPRFAALLTDGLSRLIVANYPEFVAAGGVGGARVALLEEADAESLAEGDRLELEGFGVLRVRGVLAPQDVPRDGGGDNGKADDGGDVRGGCGGAVAVGRAPPWLGAGGWTVRADVLFDGGSSVAAKRFAWLPAPPAPGEALEPASELEGPAAELAASGGGARRAGEAAGGGLARARLHFERRGAGLPAVCDAALARVATGRVVAIAQKGLFVVVPGAPRGEGAGEVALKSVPSGRAVRR